MKYIFARPVFTDWTIVITSREFDKYQEEEKFAQGGDFEEFSAVFRTGSRNGKQCEMFTLLAKDVDYAYLWVNIFKNGDIEYVSHIPSVINTDKKNKIIEISPLVYCKFDRDSRCFEYTYLREYQTDFVAIIK